MTDPVPDDALRAWALLMRVFPGSFPPPVFDGLELSRYCAIHALALAHLQAEAEAQGALNCG